MIAGIDIGTTSISGVLCAESADAVLATCCLPHGADRPGLPAGRHEQSPDAILAAVAEVLQTLARSAAGAIRGIALTGQMHGLVIVDAALRPLTPCITWRDARTNSCPASLVRHAYAEQTGCFLHPGYGGLTLHHLARNGALPAQAFKALSLPGFVAARLTGRCAIDETLAASWGIWDVRANRWHPELLAQTGIPIELLPEWVPSAKPLGRAMPGWAVAPEATVYSPLGDNQAGVVGALRHQAASAVVNVGTSSQLSLPLASFRFDPRFETRPLLNGRFLQTFAVLCGGWSYAYLARFFQQVIEQIAGLAIDLEQVYAGMQRMADGDAQGLRVDTRFAGQRMGEAPRAGSISGISTDNLRPENLAQAFVEGVADELAEAAAALDSPNWSTMVLIGNAVRRIPALRRAIEARFAIPCCLGEVPEEAAHGAVCAVMDLANKEKNGE